MERLAEAANLSVSHISKAERAQCEIGLKALLKISTAFGMKAPWILPCAGHIAGMVEEAVQASGLCILNMYNSL